MNSPKNEGKTNIIRTPGEPIKVEERFNDVPGVRYKNTDEMVAEFGSYRVNDNTDALCDSVKPEYNNNMEDIINVE